MTTRLFNAEGIDNEHPFGLDAYFSWKDHESKPSFNAKYVGHSRGKAALEHGNGMEWIAWQ